MSQEHVGYPYEWTKEDPIEAYWSAHGRRSPAQPFLFDEILEREAQESIENDPWTNGANALAAIVLGLIVMLLLSIPSYASHKKSHKGTRVQAIEQRADAPKCMEVVRVVGSQDVRLDAAEQSAQKAWMEEVRWTYGEAFQDFSNAKDYSKRCSRSSIGEALGQFFTRCEIEAKPCRGVMVKEAGQ